jgi:carbamoyltransferase
MIILSFHNSLEASAAIYINGEIKAAVSEERFNRIKNFRGFPNRSINYLLKKFNINFKKIDYVIYGMINSISPNQNTLIKINQKLKKISPLYTKKFYERINSEIKWNKTHLNEIFKYAKKMSFSDKLVLIDHHEAHAAGAYFTSPFKDAMVFTFDGKGGFKSSSIYKAKNSKFVQTDFLTTFDSLGYFYGNITRALGFKSERHEGKVTGLAAYGKKTTLIDYFKSFIKIKNNTMNIEFGKHYLPWFINKNDLPSFFKKLSYYSKEDIAFASQTILEEAIVYIIKKNISKNKKTNICLSGGVMANVKLNQKIREIKNVKNVYIQPAMGDAGLVIGAVYAFLSKKNKVKPRFLNTVSLGTDYKKNEIRDILNKKNIKFNYIKNISDTLTEELKKNKIIGFFSGKMEFGPRALCNRSILYHGKDTNVNSWLNKKLQRTEFMPFAPVTIEEYAKKCFFGWKRNDVAADFMTMTYKCTPEFIKSCPASVHVDKTARPQIIRKTNNFKLHKILKEYFTNTGEMALINTSFNKHEEPIVESINDAIHAFKNKIIDTLIIENYVIKNKE